MIHTAVLLTSEKCGHCRNMRGNGRLLSKNEIKQQNKQPNIPGGHHYDATYFKKLITAEMNQGPKVRVINIHYKSFNPSEGLMDISIFTLDTDGNNVKQEMLKEKEGKTQRTVYAVGDSGKVISSDDLPVNWNETVKSYTPINLPNYAFFFPSLILFESKAWNESIEKKTPIYGYLNGFETKTESPYGAVPGAQPNVMDFGAFLKQFFDGSKELLTYPKNQSVAPVIQESVEEKVVVKTAGMVKQENKLIVPTAGARDKLKFRLYVKE